MQLSDHTRKEVPVKTELPQHDSRNIERYSPDPSIGLSDEQVQTRKAQSLVNGESEIKTKSVGQIIRENVINPFNILNIVLAILVLSVGSLKNALFMNIIIINICIGCFQEIRAKKTIDRLSLISAPKATAVRNGKLLKIPVSDIVLDDILHLSSGNQVCADCILVQGSAKLMSR